LPPGQATSWSFTLLQRRSQLGEPILCPPPAWPATSDCSVIALWLGHESIETTQTYLHAHLALKQAALANPLAYLTDMLERIVADRTKITEIEALLPWNWRPAGMAELPAAA